MSKDSSAKYDQNNKKDYKTTLLKNIEVFLKMKKKNLIIWTRTIYKSIWS